MYEVTAAVNKYAEEINLPGITPRDMLHLVRDFQQAVIDDARDINSLLDEADEENDEGESDRTLGTYYINIEPNVEKVREVLEELSRLGRSELKYS